MNKKLNLILAGSIFAAAGTAFGQMGAPQEEERGAAPAQPEQRAAQPAQPERPQGQAPQPGQPEQAEPEQDPAEMQAKLEELHDELEAISVRLNEIHEEALLAADVRQHLIDYETTLSEKMEDNAPGLEDQVAAHANVLEEIGGIRGDAEDLASSDRQQLESLLEQHAELKQQLAPIEGQFLNDADMHEARAEYQENLIAAMHEVDPEVDDIIQERMELAQNFMSLQQEFLQTQQPAQGQQPGQGGGGQQPAQGQGQGQPAPGR